MPVRFRFVFVSFLFACGSSPTPAREDDGGRARDAGRSGSAVDAAFDASPAACDRLVLTVRDFREDHPDFENHAYQVGDSRVARTGLVETRLDADHKPVHAASGPTAMTAGPERFAEWYRDVEGVNQRFEVEIPLTSSGDGRWVYDSAAFFPVDGRGFGDGTYSEGGVSVTHNFHFSTELHTRFRYRGGEVLTFRGDDDLWIFVEDELVLDLGGLHEPVEGTIDFDAIAGRLGLEIGGDYRLSLFHAERHSTGSNFRIETSIECFELI
ncbi:MAG: fibro-slime domain-containing protein [Sandaracinus sp.]|nr:fibro-slime domain-containing protein [Sandaracinus sp.]